MSGGLWTSDCLILALFHCEVSAATDPEVLEAEAERVYQLLQEHPEVLE